MLCPKENVIFVATSYTPGGITQPGKLNAKSARKRNISLKVVYQRFLSRD